MLGPVVLSCLTLLCLLLPQQSTSLLSLSLCLCLSLSLSSYIISLFTESNNRTNRYVLPKPRIDLYKTSLSFSGSACWNSLPVAIKTVGTIKSFKRELHQFLMGE